VEFTASSGTVLVWGELNTSQTPNYTTIITNQTPSYTIISTNQTPSYSEIDAGRDAA